ncbi:MAG: MFS transporter [Terriglobales bacterium]
MDHRRQTVPTPAAPTPRYFPWPKRVDIAALCFAALVIAYCDRVNIAVAAPRIMAERHWDLAQMSWVLSGFFLGYAIFLIPSGLLVQRIGPYKVLLVSMAGWSLLTILTPIPRTLPGMFAARVALGVFESAMFPCMNGLLAAWFPRHEYARAAGFCWSGGYAGPILAFPVAEQILVTWGWPPIFWVFGLLGIVLLLVSRLVARDTPPGAQELAPQAPFLSNIRLLGRREVWAVFILHFSSNWFVYLLLTWLPTYLKEARHFSASFLGTASALPFLAALCGANIFAVVIAKLSARSSKTRVRKGILVFYVLGGLALMQLPRAGSPVAITATLIVAAALMTSATPVYAAGSLELAPGAAAALVGMQQAFANLAGIFAPVVSGYLARTSWNRVFAVAALICFAGTAAYIAMGSAEPLSSPEPESSA